MADTIKLLFVDDEPLIRELLQDALTDAGFTVVTAESGADAMTALEDPEQELCGLITDIRLGEGADGWAVARHARELVSAFPVVYTTADSAGDWGAQGVPNSILVQKPFAVTQVITAISTLLNDPAQV